MKYTGNAKSTPMMDSQPPKNGSVQANGTKTVPSMVDSEVNGADETPDISNGHNTERAFENLPHDAEPVAIVGIACRLPGNVSSALDLWNLLIHAESGHGSVPSSRFNAKAFYNPDANYPGGINSETGYFLKDKIHDFENGFFGINNLEAQNMDPQQRKLLEVVYECFENAGRSLDEVSGSDTGCYIGNYTFDFALMQFKDPEHFTHYSATGLGPTILANRVSHIFNLRGPSVVLDTACSSSLYALHSACLALGNKDCTSAIVASANLIQTPEQHIAGVKTGVLSTDATCHSFDAAANGYGRAEGVGALYLKPLSAAIRDGDRIRSVIRGTAVNSNGRTNGITLPSASGQEAVIRKAYKRAGLLPNATDYVEAHGTGTAVGDPIEVEGISRVFQHKNGKPTLIGSIKTNLGHSEGSSGISSIIKVSLALEKRLIPPTIGLKRLNPKILADEWNVQVVTEPTFWPESNVPRAGINSFGVGGANAHVILESASCHVPSGDNQATSERCMNPPTSSERPFLLPFAARTESSLCRIVGRTSTYAVENPSTSLTDVFRGLIVREQFKVRGYIVSEASNINKTIHFDNLKTLGSNKAQRLPLAYIFTGQGAQSPRMGVDLMKCFPTFQNSIKRLDSILASLHDSPPSWSLIDILIESSDKNSISSARCSQPACTALQLALVDLFCDWGIAPNVVLGHSSGEIAAAYAAGFISARTAITIAYYRGLVVSRIKEEGAMMAVGIGPDQADEEIGSQGLEEFVGIACINSPDNVTLSGNSDGIESLRQLFQNKHLFARKLKTDGRAYHSHHVRSVGKDYENLLAAAWDESQEMTLNASKEISMISTVTGGNIQPKLVQSPEYWRRNLESTVLFKQAIQYLFGRERYHLVEIGPHPALELPIKQTWKPIFTNVSDPLLYNGTLHRGRNSAHTVLDFVGSLYLHGHDVDFMNANGLLGSNGATSARNAQRRLLKDFPSYPWAYENSLWTEPRISSEYRHRQYPRHELLGSRIHGGSGLEYSWRNVLDISQSSWMQDHCLGPTTVLPGAAFLSLTIEAMHQVLKTDPSHCIPLEIRDFSILNALVLQHGGPNVEVFTTVELHQLSHGTISKQWWSVKISSFVNNVATIHAKGSARADWSGNALARGPLLPQDTLEEQATEEQATRVWYEKFRQEELNFGPSFALLQNIRTDKSKRKRVALAKTPILRGESGRFHNSFQYRFHPITIDTMLQAALIATTSGIVRELKGKIPVSIGRALFGSPGDVEPTNTDMYSIRASSEIVGFGTAHSLAELYNSKNEAVIQLENVRLVEYGGKRQQKVLKERTPLVRISWKPDICLFGRGINEGFGQYLEWYANRSGPGISCVDSGRLAGAIDLIAHKWPNLRILELISESNSASTPYLNVVNANPSLRRFQTYTLGLINEHGELFGQRHMHGNTVAPFNEDRQLLGVNDIFDLFIISDPKCTGFDLKEQMIHLHNHAAPDANILYTIKESEVSAICNDDRKSLLEPPTRGASVALSRFSDQASANTTQRAIHFIILYRDDEEIFAVELQSQLRTLMDMPVTVLKMTQIAPETLPQNASVISMLELCQPLLTKLDEATNRRLKILTGKASRILWITRGCLFTGSYPDFSLVSGLSRAVMLEQPSLQFSILDVDNLSEGYSLKFANVVAVLRHLLNCSNPDLEFMQIKDIVHISRWIAEDAMNDDFIKKQNEDTEDVPLQDVGPCRLSIKHPGDFDSIHFIPSSWKNDELQPDHIEISVKSVGMNAKDLYVLAAKVDTKNVSCSCEYTGIVVKVGFRVEKFRPGDRVVVMAPGQFGNFERVPQWACEHLLPEESLTVFSTVPLVSATAIYSLQYCARLQPGESILIHSATGGVGLVAIQLAQKIGAQVFATVGTLDKKNYLMQTCGIASDHIFDSRSSSFLAGIMDATSNRGVDVVLNSLTGELLHDSWRACAEFGRFIELGKRDILDKGCLEMDVFSRNVMFTAFDLSSFYHSNRQTHQEMWHSLLCESLSLFRANSTSTNTPLKVFGIEDITQAFRYFSSPSRLGKIAVSFENPQAPFKILPPKYDAQFDQRKTYLMVGCLGGLGRSITKWMFTRGARKFVFLSRSGLERRSALDLVNSLRNDGAVADVVRGSVTKYEDVEAMIQEAKGPIGGVIQAAMGLEESLWDKMSADSWHCALDPKVIGTWNLHNALRANNRDYGLEFFLMTSSISGTVGTATESNYCSGNAFLDAFARYRRSLGLPALSVGLGMISEVGYLHEHPEIEALMIRKGIHAINEDELLQIFDLALSNDPAKCYRGGNGVYDQGSLHHLLTGVEFVGLAEQRRRGFEGHNHVLHDPRASLFAAAYDRSTPATNLDEIQRGGDRVGRLLTDLQAENSSASMLDIVKTLVTRKIANLILLAPEEVKTETQFSEYGLDSMLAAELRGHIFREMEVDVPFMTLLDKNSSVNSLSQLIASELSTEQAEGQGGGIAS